MRLSLLVALTAGCVHAPVPEARHTVELAAHTADGWTLPIRHHRGAGPPVVLFHGVGFEAVGLDFGVDASLAQHLAGSGFDVWVPSLRGDGDATPPSEDARFEVSIEDMARLDVAAVLELVVSRTGAPEVLAVGHGTGGAIVLAAVESGEDRIGAAVTVGATLEGESRVSRRLARAARLSVRQVDLDRRGKMTSWMGRRSPVVDALTNAEALEPAWARAIARHAMGVVSKHTAAEIGAGLPTAMVDVPVMMVGAEFDQVSSVEAVEAHCAMLRDCTFQEAPGLGHLDAVLGEEAAEVVFPWIVDFLATHEAAPDALLASAK